MAREHFDVAGRTVFITGAARGIGAGAAERLHARGANVALVGLEPDRLEELAARLGDRAACYEADVTDMDSLESAVRETIARFGAIDVAIANAGISFTGSIAGGRPEQFERTVDVNLMGVWRTNRAVIGEITRRRGYLLNIASASVIFHAPLMGAYTTAKSGVEALTDALRMETAPSGARVGCAYFGFIDTDMVRAGFALPTASRLNESVPSFLIRPRPVSTAVDAIERGVERRAARVYSPRWVAAMSRLRGIGQPLTEWRSLRDPRLAESVAASDASGEADRLDPVLGVAANELAERPAVTQPG
jgi:NAD(P)-dependent dehydrogenase (short-subunit alcohol dehydrogenase family)